MTGDAESAARRASGPWAPCLGTGALLGVLLAAGCGEGTEPSPDDVSDPGVGTAGSAEPAYEAPCQRKGFSCTWGEVSSDALWLTDRLGWMAVDIMERTGSLGAVVDFLRGAEGIAEVWVGDFSVQFRVEGGRPAWVDAPSDPDNPRLGGGRAADVRRAESSAETAVGQLPGAPSAFAMGELVPRAGTRVTQDGDGDRNGVAANKGREGEGKRALFLAPMAWHIGGLGLRVEELETVRDYSDDAGGSITYLANGSKDGPNPRMTSDRWDEYEVFNVDDLVTLEAFENWDEYSFVYLETHGQAKCEGAECHTVLDAGQAFLRAGDAAAAAAVADRPGVELRYVFSQLDPELGRAERRACKDFLEGDEDPEIRVEKRQVEENGDAYTALVLEPGPDRSRGTCFRRERVERSALVSLSTAFFEDVYGEAGTNGLENTIVFLSACQSLKGEDLARVLTNDRQNENVAVFGYDAISNSAWSAKIGSSMILHMGIGYDSGALYELLKEQFPESPLDGVVLADDMEPADLEPASVVNQASNPTHGRDVVELVNPLTGEELRDGGSLLAVGAPGDGQPDAARVQMRVRGIDSETDIGQIDVFLEVDGRPGSRPHALAREVEESLWDVAENTVELGFDVDRQGSHDLEIRATLEGGGESRWRYEDIRLATCFYHATWSGPFSGSHSSPYIRAQGAQVSFPDPFTNDRGFGMSTRFHAANPPPLETGTFKPRSVNATFETEAWNAVASYDADGVWSSELPDPVVRIDEVTDAHVRGTVEASLVMNMSSPKPFDPYAEPLPQEPFQVSVEFQYARRHGAADCPQP